MPGGKSAGGRPGFVIESDWTPGAAEGMGGAVGAVVWGLGAVAGSSNVGADRCGSSPQPVSTTPAIIPIKTVFLIKRSLSDGSSIARAEPPKDRRLPGPGHAHRDASPVPPGIR